MVKSAEQVLTPASTEGIECGSGVWARAEVRSASRMSIGFIEWIIDRGWLSLGSKVDQVGD
jgi:hypothetical protein